MTIFCIYFRKKFKKKNNEYKNFDYIQLTIISESGILTFVSIISVLLALLRSIYNT